MKAPPLARSSVPSDTDPPTAPPRAADALDRLAGAVASEAFAVGFVWWAALVVLAPACVFCAMGLHADGAVGAAVTVGLIGVGVAAVSVLRLASVVGSLRGPSAA